jgi:hypothetical protein
MTKIILVCKWNSGTHIIHDSANTVQEAKLKIRGWMRDGYWHGSIYHTPHSIISVELKET